MRKTLFILISCAAIISVSCRPDATYVPPSDTPVEKPEEDPLPVIPEWETAQEAISHMGIGWNLGNTLDALGDMSHDGSDWRYWETCWGQPVTVPELFTMMKEAGFNAIRVPVSWGAHMDDSGNVYGSWMNRVREVVDYVLFTGMYCIINVHHDTGADDKAWLIASSEDYLARKDRFESLWRQIAEEFKGHGERLLFESYNEMLDSRRSWCFASFNGGHDPAFAADAYEAINSYAQSFVDAVRTTGGNNLARNLIVNTYGACSGAGTWNVHLKDPLIYMELPDDVADDHLIFEIHTYPEIDDINGMKAETEDMFASLNTHLVSKGAPLIIGEWGHSSKNPPQENIISFLDHFVRKAKENGFATFYWMGLSDGNARSLPAFSQPEYAETILKAYHGDSHQGKIPTADDFEITYDITYTSQWGEVNISASDISLEDFIGVEIELAEAPGTGDLAIKIYGEKDGMEQYSHFSTSGHSISFDRMSLGKSSRRITLQYMKAGTFATTVRSASLIRSDGTRQQVTLSPFWGCSVEMKSAER